MGFLKNGGFGKRDGFDPAAGLGHMIGAEPSRVSQVADRIGNGMNMIAAAGGAQPGYVKPVRSVMPAQPVGAPEGAAPDNHLQMLDTEVLRNLIARFRPSSTGVQL